MTDVVQQIKDRLNILDVVSPYVEVQKAGKQFKCKCPFHNEKTPSFNISPERGMYHCYGCGVGGDIFTFIEAIEGVDFKGALKILADKAGVQLTPVSPEKQSERDRLYATLEATTKFYVEELKKNPEALAYLKKRGVTDQTVASWRIGFAPGPPVSSWRATKEHLQAQGFSLKELMGAGIIKGADQGKEPYDVFRNRIMFPLFDQGGRVVAFSGRTLEVGADIPKYVNSPETELFKKSEILYGYDRAKHGIRHLDFSLIVEGQFDVVMSHQAGYNNTVAVSGTALTASHVQLLERLSHKVVLALDADKAGISAAKRSADIMLRRGLDVKVAMMPFGKDPADIILEDPKEFRHIIGNSVHVIEFLLSILSAQNLNPRTFKLRAREEVIPYVPLLPNKIDQDHFEAIIAESLKTTKDAVHYEVERATEILEQETKSASTAVVKLAEEKLEVKVVAPKRRDSVLAFLLGALPLCSEGTQSKLKKEISHIIKVPVAELDTLVPVEKRAEVMFKAEAFVNEQPRRLFDAEIIHSLNQLRGLIIKQELNSTRSLLDEAEQSGDQLLFAEKMARVSELQRALQDSPYTVEDIIFT